ncbi:MAG: tetraacyldisaccharide 4'-kinase [Pricia sp.]
MRLLRKILYPLSLIYALVVSIRNWLYDTGFFTSFSFNTPTICIGNLSVGGTGKTPMAEFLIRLLKDDYKIALLSRGYRRSSSGFMMANSESTVAELGDEPFQIHTKFPKITVAVDADRRIGIQMLEDKVSPEIIVLDDAFQHRKVNYGFSILLTAYSNLYVDDFYLPTGNLRDSRREARRADIIVVTKCPTHLSEQELIEITRKLNPEPHQEVLFSSLEYDQNLKGAGGTLGSLANRNITLVTGIANPEPLVAYLREAGLVFEHLRFKDHHNFSDTELARLRTKEVLLTTEKDYMRLQDKVENLYYLSVRHRFLNDGRKILQNRLENFMAKRS